MIRTLASILFVLFSAFALPQSADKTPPPAARAPHVTINPIPARPADVSTIDGIIKAYYEVVSGPAGQPRQWDRDSTLYIPKARFVLFTEDASGNASAQSMSHQQFVDESKAILGSNGFFEHEIHRIIHRFGNVAHVLSTAEHFSSLNGPSAGRSIDSLELFWDGHRWWIVSANIWPGDAPGRPLSHEFLPN